jgi:putative transposase
VRELFDRSQETMRLRYGFRVIRFVVMPDHVHLLLTEPTVALLAKALQALKLSVAMQQTKRPFWQARYYDFNVFTEDKRVEKLLYMHRNPVVRGLIADPADWAWSSFRHYSTGQRGVAEIDSRWTWRDRGDVKTQVSEARPGAPSG